MNRNTVALLLIVALMIGGLVAVAGYQRGKAMPPVTASKPGGGLVINSAILPGESEPVPGATAAPPAGSGEAPPPLAAPADASAACP